MALGTPDMHRAICGLSDDVRDAGGRFILSDLFRSYDMQFQAHLDWKTGKKKAYSPPPGGSMHESGRAFDVSLKDLKMSLGDFWNLATQWGVVPIIDTPDSRKSEAWHFECRGSHVRVSDYYRAGKGSNMNAYRAMAISSILAIGVDVDRFGSNQQEAFLQSCLVRLGMEIGNIDGIIGSKTRGALAEIGVADGDISEALSVVEDRVQELFPDEFGVRREADEDLFDFTAPNHVLG
jgi:hypothetical protein